MEEERDTCIDEDRNIGFKKASVETEGGHFEERPSFEEPKKRLLRLTAVRKIQEVELGEVVSKEDKSRRGRLEESWGVTMHEVVVDSEASSNPPSGVTGIQRPEYVDEPNTAENDNNGNHSHAVGMLGSDESSPNVDEGNGSAGEKGGILEKKHLTEFSPRRTTRKEKNDRLLSENELLLRNALEPHSPRCKSLGSDRGGTKRRTANSHQLRDNGPEPRSKRRCPGDEGVKTISGPDEGNIAKQRKSSKKGEDAKDVRLVTKRKPRLGDLVTVCWDGYNYNCKVVEIEDKRVKVHYLKWSSGYDEWVALSGASHEGDSTIDGEDSAGVPPQTKKRKIQTAISKDGESAARRGNHEVEDMAELLKRSKIDLVPSLPPTKVL